MKKKILFLMVILGTLSFAESTIDDNKELLKEISTTTPKIVSGYKSAKDAVNTTFAYNENSMYTIYARINYLTTIMLQPGEKILFVGGGDTSRWRRAEAVTGSQEGERPVIYIKPNSLNLKTNLVINTNKRSYQINLISHKSLFNPVVKWSYPEDDLIQKINYQERQQQLEANQEKITDPTALNYAYTINTNKYNFTPRQVFDDGLKTFILLPENLQEMPTFYVKDGKTLLLVNYRTKGNFLVIDRLFEQGELRIGKKIIIIKKKK